MIYFVAGAPLILLLIVAISIILSGIFAYSFSEHFARRIDGFLSAKIDPNTQIGYATNAIQEGGIFGVGVGEGIVKNILPDAHTDFIIAVAAATAIIKSVWASGKIFFTIPSPTPTPKIPPSWIALVAYPI